MSCKLTRLVDAHFAATIRPDDERSLREHLPGCSACHARYERHLLLARLDPQAIPAEERIARGLGLRATGGPVHRLAPRLAVAVGTLAAAAAVLMLFARGGSAPSRFSARGRALPEEAASRVFTYEVRPGMPPVLAGGALSGDSDLAFAYENRAAKPRLLVFGVDEHRHVYWFYPAWTDEAADPAAIAVETDGKHHELGEAIHHRSDGTHLEIHSVFVDQPVSVRRVEALLRERASGPLPIPGAIEDITVLEVRR